MGFLAEFAGKQPSLATFGDALSLNRTRQFMPGDTLLFRPLTHAVLYLQLLVFHYNFILWQLTALCCHLFACWALARLLVRYSGESTGEAAAVWIFCAFFAFQFANVEAVIWHHIAPYVIFAALVLLALERLEVYVSSQGENVGALMVCVLFLLLSVLFHEIGVWYALCFFLFVASRSSVRCRKQVLFLLFPAAVYIIISCSNWLLLNMANDGESVKIATGLFSWETLKNLVVAIKWFLSAGLFLQPSDLMIETRLHALPSALQLGWPLTDWSANRVMGFATLCTLAAAVFFVLKRGDWRKDYVRLVMFGLMFLGYAALISAGRMNVRADALSRTLYYSYGAWIIIIPALFLLIRPIFESPVRSAGLRTAVAGVLLAFAFVNALDIHSISLKIAVRHYQAREFFSALERFVDKHKAEPDLSFSLPDNSPYKYEVSWEKKGSPQGSSWELIALLYPRYYRTEGGKYVLDGRLLR